MPSKFYGTAAAGRPVLFIGASGGEIDRLTKQHNCGQTVANGDGKALANAILELARDPQLTSRMGENARHACEDFYDKSIAIQGWASMLRGLSVTKEMPSAAEEDQTFRPEIADSVLTK